MNPRLKPSSMSNNPEAEAATVSITINFPQLQLVRALKKFLHLLVHTLRMLSRRAITALYQLTSVKRLLAPKTAATPFYRQRLFMLAAILLVIGLVVGGQTLLPHSKQTLGTEPSLATGASGTAKPSFTPVVPQDRPDLATMQSGKIAYDSKKSVLSFADTLKGTAIVVSEQQLPRNFTSADEAVTSIAKSLNATQAVVTSGGKGYIATDSKSNSQTIVYSTANLLIFLQSPFIHQLNDWQSYLGLLQQPSS